MKGYRFIRINTIFSLSGIIIVLAVFLLFSNENNSVIRITAVGDIRISKKFITKDWQQIKKIHLNGDLVFANFEGVLSEETLPNPFILTMPNRTPSVLKEMGLSYLNLANNHALDLGVNNYRKTYHRLKQEGFSLSGCDDSGDIQKIRDRTVQIIGFSFNSPNNVNDLKKATQIIKSCKADIIIVSAHMGGENGKGYIISGGMEYFYDEKRGDVIKFSHICIDAGADLVLGHSPHILRKIELYKNKLIVYSLGNFIFDYPGVEENAYAPGFSITTFLNTHGDFEKAKIDSYSLKYGIPQSDNNQRAFRFIKKLSLKDHTNLIFRENGWVLKK